MKKLGVLFLLGAFILVANPGFAQQGANEKALEHASDQAIFNRVGDWFATIGKKGAEKEKILAERKAQRTAKRAEKEAKKVMKGAEDKAEDVAEEVEKEAGKMKGKMKDMTK